MRLCSCCRRLLPDEAFAPKEQRSMCRECRREARRRSEAKVAPGLGLPRRIVYLQRYREDVRLRSRQRRRVSYVDEVGVLEAQRVFLDLADDYTLSPRDLLEAQEERLFSSGYSGGDNE